MRSHGLFSIVSAVAVVTVAGCGPTPETATARAAEPAVAVVKTVTPEKATILKVSREPGQVEAFEMTALHAKVAGYVKTLSADIGDSVRKGQVLAELDVPELHAELLQKKASVEQADAGLVQARALAEVAQAAVASAEAKIVEVRATVRRTEADVARWQAEYTRTSQLVRERALTGSVLDETQSKLKSAEAARDETSAQVRSAEAALAQAKAEKAKADSDIVAANANIDVARADLARTEALVGFARIIAPFDGVVTHRHVHTGHLTVPGGASDPLFVVARTDRLRVVADVPEVDAPLVNPGDQAEVQLPAFENRTLSGTVSRVSWSLERATRTMRAEIDLPNPDGSLRAGLYAVATIIAEERRDVIAVPPTAVIREGGKAFCVVVEDGKARRREVRTGLSDGQKIEILSGLQGTEAVVPTNAASLVDGQAVKVEAPAAK